MIVKGGFVHVAFALIKRITIVINLPAQKKATQETPTAKTAERNFHLERQLPKQSTPGILER
jgi:hypothetical protein